MVDHLTRVEAERSSPRADLVGRALEGLGFSIRLERGRLLGESGSVEASRVRVVLRELGLHDSDYQVVVEFARQWGVM